MARRGYSSQRSLKLLAFAGGGGGRQEGSEWENDKAVSVEMCSGHCALFLSAALSVADSAHYLKIPIVPAVFVPMAPPIAGLESEEENYCECPLALPV